MPTGFFVAPSHALTCTGGTIWCGITGCGTGCGRAAGAAGAGTNAAGTGTLTG